MTSIYINTKKGLCNTLAQLPQVTQQQLTYMKKVVVDALWKSKYADLFKHPVDVSYYMILDYPTIVKCPMNLKQIRTNLNRNVYTSVDQCLSDLNTMFCNCFIYNHPGDFVVNNGIRLRELMRLKLRGMPQATPHLFGGTHNTQRDTEDSINSDSKDSSTYGGDDPTSHKRPRESSTFDATGTPANGGEGQAKRPRKKMKLEIPPDLEIGNRKKRLSKSLKACSNLLKELMSKKNEGYNSLFMQPVNANDIGCHEYYDIIKSPMDLSTIKTKLENGTYESKLQFETDIRLIFSNCFLFNGAKSPVSESAKYLQSIFESRWPGIPDDEIDMGVLTIGANNVSKVPALPVVFNPPVVKESVSKAIPQSTTSSKAPVVCIDEAKPVISVPKAPDKLDNAIQELNKLIKKQSELMDFAKTWTSSFMAFASTFQFTTEHLPSAPAPRKHESSISGPEQTHAVAAPYPLVSGLSSGASSPRPPSLHHHDLSSTTHDTSQDLSQTMDGTQKQHLVNLIHSLDPPRHCKVYRFLQKKRRKWVGADLMEEKTDEGEIELDMEKLDEATLWSLQRYVTKLHTKMNKKSKKEKKKKTRERHKEKNNRIRFGSPNSSDTETEAGPRSEAPPTRVSTMPLKGELSPFASTKSEDTDHCASPISSSVVVKQEPPAPSVLPQAHHTIPLSSAPTSALSSALGSPSSTTKHGERPPTEVTHQRHKSDSSSSSSDDSEVEQETKAATGEVKKPLWGSQLFHTASRNGSTSSLQSIARSQSAVKLEQNEKSSCSTPSSTAQSSHDKLSSSQPLPNRPSSRAPSPSLSSLSEQEKRERQTAAARLIQNEALRVSQLSQKEAASREARERAAQEAKVQSLERAKEERKMREEMLRRREIEKRQFMERRKLDDRIKRNNLIDAPPEPLNTHEVLCNFENRLDPQLFEKFVI